MMTPSQSYFFFFLSLICNTLAYPTLQRDALLEFKNEFPLGTPELNAPFYNSLDSWNTSSDHCSWNGVTCNAHSSEVISLVLDYTYLNGSLKANTSLLKLQHLQNLTLANCNLLGEIPSSLGNLSHLIHLNISGNKGLTGEIPSSIGNLSYLSFLVLSQNYLGGKIPSSLGNLSRLTVLDLSENNLIGGDLPLILSNLSSLSRLDISDNHFKSKLPSNMSGLHNLETFDVSGNSLIGTFPISLLTLPSLREVSLSKNQFEGPLEFGNTSSSSSKLELLDLASNDFHGPIPEDISRFRKLDSIDLSDNNFIGPIPRSMHELVSLHHLNLSYNKLEGQVPNFLWRLDTFTLSHNSFNSLEEVVVNGSHYDLSSTSFQGLSRVDIGSNSLQGSLPRWICKSKSLAFLDLSNNFLSGSIPSCLLNSAASLTHIILRNNSLSGFLPDIFTNATKLRWLDVSRNQLSGKLPRSLINCTSMDYLNLKANKFKDTFPSWLGSLEILSVLFLGSNAFYGPISSSSFGFPSLRVIDISNNSFDGTLPQDYFVNWPGMAKVGGQEVYVVSGSNETFNSYMEEVSYEDSMDMMYKGVDTKFQRILFAYKAIDFSGNRFTGQIPKSLGLLRHLIHINFSRNAFTSTIPSSLANITKLEALDPSHNNLSGNIPSGLAKLSFLSYLDFSHNFLQGPIPRSTQFQSQNCSSFEDNLGLYGLEEVCGPIYVPHPTSGDSQHSEEFSSEESEEVLSWIAAAIAYGPGVFCGLVIGYIFFTSHKHIWFMEKFRGNHPGGIITLR